MKKEIFDVKPNFGIFNTLKYKGGEQIEKSVHNVSKLNSNENPFGPSPRAIDAIRKCLTDLSIYPSSSHRILREKIAETHSLDYNKIACGAGSDEIISFICQCFCGVGDEVIHTVHGFAMYKISALLRGAIPVEVAEKNRVADVEAILKNCSEKTRIVFLANPNNPTGTFLKDGDIKVLLESLPKNVLIVLDGAYAEYIKGFDGGISHVANFNNLIILRTFSKIYGLASLRVGWCYASERIIETINQVRGPFNLSAPAIAAASASVQDNEYLDYCRKENLNLRESLKKNLTSLGLRVPSSNANFLLADFKSKLQADAAAEYLRSKKILVRRVDDYNLPKSLRISIGKKSDCAKLTEKMQSFMETQNVI
tara:strand:- start:86 stop:1189 length:1104 start_codon:yes stop_codon:yes gene_type:complete